MIEAMKLSHVIQSPDCQSICQKEVQVGITIGRISHLYLMTLISDIGVLCTVFIFISMRFISTLRLKSPIF